MNMRAIEIMVRQAKYLDMKEKYMRYHKRLGAREALEAYNLPEAFVPPDEYKYTKEEITEDEEEKFRLEEDTRFCGMMREAQIIGAVEALRAAGIDDEEIVSYITELWQISEGHARNHMELS
ncbi:MAG: hypothetical protein IJQ24_09595 [Synergistaceae bacterium]|nr:hypothetical protein [Synergistaceae bacterium]